MVSTPHRSYNWSNNSLTRPITSNTSPQRPIHHPSPSLSSSSSSLSSLSSHYSITSTSQQPPSTPNNSFSILHDAQTITFQPPSFPPSLPNPEGVGSRQPPTLNDAAFDAPRTLENPRTFTTPRTFRRPAFDHNDNSGFMSIDSSNFNNGR